MYIYIEREREGERERERGRGRERERDLKAGARLTLARWPPEMVEPPGRPSHG